MAPLPVSPALNHGTPFLDETDQRGVVRTGGENIGAYQAGRPPFRGPTVMDVLMLAMRGEVVPPGKLHKVPRDLEAICLKCLQPDPARRYADGEELADDLRRFQEGRRAVARPGGFWSRLFSW
jgi:hypothetical protein